MDKEQLEEITTRAAVKALEMRGESDVERIFEILGADISTPDGRKAIKDNWSWLTDTRLGTQFVRKTTWGAVIAAFVAGLAWLITKGIAVASNLAAKMVSTP